MREGAMAEALKLAEALVPAPNLTRAGRNTPNVGIEPPKVGSNDGLGPDGETR